MALNPDDYPVRVKVSGPWACFTRPELKVERVSYPVMTPSAARGVLEAIFWKRQLFRWNVRRITVLNQIQFSGIRRNEVTARLGKGLKPLVADECRDQRNTVALRNVAYVIEATMHLMGNQERPIGHSNPYMEYRERFHECVRRGTSFAQPVLGCREFAAEYEPVEGDSKGIDRTEPLGLMFYDFFDIADHSENQRAIPRFFAAELKHGVLVVDRTKVTPRLKGLVEP